MRKGTVVIVLRARSKRKTGIAGLMTEYVNGKHATRHPSQANTNDSMTLTSDKGSMFNATISYLSYQHTSAESENNAAAQPEGQQ